MFRFNPLTVGETSSLNATLNWFTIELVAVPSAGRETLTTEGPCASVMSNRARYCASKPGDATLLEESDDHAVPLTNVATRFDGLRSPAVVPVPSLKRQ